MRSDNLPDPPLQRELLDENFGRMPERKPVRHCTGPRPAGGEGVVATLGDIHHFATSPHFSAGATSPKRKGSSLTASFPLAKKSRTRTAQQTFTICPA